MSTPASGVAEIIERARAALQRNDVSTAASLADEALALAPGQASALHLAGVVAARRGRLQTAGDLLQRAADAADADVDHLHDFAEFCYRTGRLEEAATVLARAFDLRPGRADLCVKLGFVRLRQGRIEAAIEAVHRALAHASVPLEELVKLAGAIRDSRPALPSAMHAAGLVEARAGRAEPALDLLSQAARAGNSITFWYDLAQLCFQLNQQNAAADALSRAIDLAPARADLRVKLALVRLRQQQSAAAESLLREAVAMEPDSVDAQGNLANLLASERDGAEALEEAARLYERCLFLAPDEPRLHSGYGNLLARLGRSEEAMARYQRALALAPENVEARVNLAKLHQADGRYAQAETLFRAALARQPNYAAAHRGLGHVLLAQGRLTEGWREYHHRFFVDAASGRLKVRPFGQPWWSGQPLRGRRILAWAEQGIGEELMYAGLIPELVGEAAGVVVECDPRLVPLLARSFPNATTVARQTPPDPRASDPTIDFQCAFGRIAGVRRPGFDSFAAHAGYLIADPARRDEVHTWLNQFGSKLKVGISWFSDNRQIGDRKSAPLPLWVKLLRRSDIVAVDLQYGDTEGERVHAARQLGIAVHRHPEIDQLADLDAFAALVSALDLVITISNTTAHMAGALGKPCWVLLHDVPFWHWFLERDDSPWYPSVRLFRQRSPGDWPDVFSRVEAAFDARARGLRPAH